MRVLIFSGIKSIGYLESLHTRLVGEGAIVDIARFGEQLLREASPESSWYSIGSTSLLTRIPKLGGVVRALQMRSFLRRRSAAYDVCHVIYNEPLYGVFLARALRRSARALGVFVVGSDFMRMGSAGRWLQRRLYRLADFVTFNNPVVKSRFNEYYRGRYSSKLHELYFGLDSLDTIDRICEESTPQENRAALGLPEDAFIVTVGYNGSAAQRHEAVLRAIAGVRSDLPEELHVVLPMTYGATAEYRRRIESVATNQELPHAVLADRLNVEAIGHLRLATDVLVHLQPTDSFSASVQEHLYAGSLVINGAWLPYESMKKRGVDYEETQSIDDLPQALARAARRAVSGDVERDGNRRIIRELSAWAVTLNGWCRLYSSMVPRGAA